GGRAARYGTPRRHGAAGCSRAGERGRARRLAARHGLSGALRADRDHCRSDGAALVTGVGKSAVNSFCANYFSWLMYVTLCTARSDDPALERDKHRSRLGGRPDLVAQLEECGKGGKLTDQLRGQPARGHQRHLDDLGPPLKKLAFSNGPVTE